MPVRLRLDGNLRVPRSVPVAPPQRLAAPLKLVQSAQPEGEVSARPASPDAPSAPPPAPAVARTAPQSYVDQVLDDSPLVITGAGASGKADEEVKGRRFLSVDYRLYARNASDVGHSVEQGTVLRYRRETLDYGELYFEGELRNYRPGAGDFQPERTLGQRFTVSQYRYALTERYQMDNALGLVRSNLSPLIGSSFRINLPASVLRGVSSTAYDGQSEWRFSSGQLARLTGIAVQQMDTLPGNLTSVGYSRRIDNEWSASAQVNTISGQDTLANHQSAAGALQYWSADRLNRFQLHVLTDSKGRSGGWFDADQRSGLLQNRYGVYRIQPDVRWTDALILTDQQGAYWRSDYRTQRYTLAGGADFTDNNVNNDPARAGNRQLQGFVSGFWRIDRTQSLSGNLSVSHSQPKFSGIGVADSTTSVSNVSLSQTMDWGVSRWQLSHTQTDSTVNPAREYAMRWDHDWALSSTRQLSTTLSHAWVNNNGIDATRATAGLVFRHSVSPTFRWDGNVTFTRVNDTAGLADNSVNAALNGVWSLNRDWSAQLQLIWNRVDNTNPLTPVYTSDKTLLFTLRYEIASGTPLAVAGQTPGSLGSGRIVGRVFFDENGDGQRQATDRPVAGLTVLLDGRYRVTTDNDGRFEFGPVATGPHEITVLVERVPLPWGLLDEAPRRVTVPLRSEAVIDVPLNKLNQ